MSRTRPVAIPCLLSAAALALAGGCAVEVDGDVDPLPEIALTCGTKLAVAKVTASGAQAGNPAGNAIDGKLTTRWSEKEVGATLTFDLGATKSICGASIAWYAGTTRVSDFAIALSSNGTSYTEVSARQSRGTTDQLEDYGFTARDARFVRLTVYGNSLSDWASVSEVAIVGGAAGAGGGKLTRAERDRLVYGNYKPSATTINNRFPRSTWGSQYYILRGKDAAGKGVGVVTGNVFEDGTAVPISNGG